MLLIERLETLRRSAAADWDTKQIGKFSDLFSVFAAYLLPTAAPIGIFASFADAMAIPGAFSSLPPEYRGE